MLLFFLTVTEAELKRLREAFKKTSSVNGCVSKNSFVKDVLGDGIPAPIAEVILLSFCFSKYNSFFRSLFLLICKLPLSVLITN